MPQDLAGLQAVVLSALEELKAVDVTVLDVSQLTSLTSVMVVASGTSSRHVRALAESARDAAKAAGYPVLGMEGDSGAEWVLVDLVDLVLHVMLPQTRALYRLEDLWSARPGRPKAEQAGDGA
ncbi:MAG TPA: ribosome silencing factor [Immundisolibacter sp.]|uniref:Ribosomal silencing factor RsfS n=1 Tax=Immundisolibacter cernigliae TaxID=1810504 RepID=A0A1B1YQY8_9GAMM|nr:ribosome silencing factor [Immundisolibacter cernigliae]ANX03169.1 ribosome silencing factor RsfS [Immundisolibacter cernigliae]HEX2796536.1 ribosome silencing factor [Immundisolibacter sp.]